MHVIQPYKIGSTVATKPSQASPLPFPPRLLIHVCILPQAVYSYSHSPACCPSLLLVSQITITLSCIAGICCSWHKQAASLATTDQLPPTGLIFVTTSKFRCCRLHSLFSKTQNGAHGKVPGRSNQDDLAGACEVHPHAKGLQAGKQHLLAAITPEPLNCLHGVPNRAS